MYLFFLVLICLAMLLVKIICIGCHVSEQNAIYFSCLFFFFSILFVTFKMCWRLFNYLCKWLFFLSLPYSITMIFGFFASVNISIERFYSISLDKMLPAGQLHQGVFTISGTEKTKKQKKQHYNIHSCKQYARGRIDYFFGNNNAV